MTGITLIPTLTRRTFRDAPEIDGKVTFICDGALNPGDFADVLITGINEYDLIGEVKHKSKLRRF